MPLMIIFWVFLIAGLVYFLRIAFNPGGSGSTKSSLTALESLNLRYAKGEISKEEYERIKKDID